MKQQYATVREFLRNHKAIMDKKHETIITVNGKPKWVYVPYDKWEEKGYFLESIIAKDLLKKISKNKNQMQTSSPSTKTSKKRGKNLKSSVKSP